jgi:protease IV
MQYNKKKLKLTNYHKSLYSDTGVSFDKGETMEDKTLTNWDTTKNILLWIALPLLIGLLVASVIPQPVIGVIHFDDVIQASTAHDLIAQLSYAREHANIRGVVLALGSPGGTVADTESVYLELAKLRATKPVVVSVGALAASGAYYLAVGSDYIYANPTSDVGNIGVIGYLPDYPTIYEGIISTGPYKLFGTPRDTFSRQVEMIKQGFFAAVKLGRGDRLKAGDDVIFTGEIWPGIDALRLGLIDEIGSETDAIQKAAALVHISNYGTIDLYNITIASATPAAYGQFYKTTDKGEKLPYPAEPGIYLLYIPPFTAGK